MAKKSYIFTSESVTEGHPDKMCDRISDTVLDALLAEDKYSRVACETLVTTGLVMIAGEITSKGLNKVDFPGIIRNAIKDIGYTDASMGFDYEHCAVVVALDQQSPDISQGVTAGAGLHKEQGAGDQGMMFGYASNETSDLMPMPIWLAHKLTKKLATVRKKKGLDFLRPDGKSQVSVEYKDGIPVRVTAVVISTQHSPDVSYKNLKEGIIEEIVKPVIPKRFIDKKTHYHINPTGRFVVGGPKGDCGLTGRKIIVDTYGGMGRHGGGAFSGKDPSKVDRSAAYLARYIAKNIVAAKLADKCEVQLAYAIGVAEPVSIMLDVFTFGTGTISESKLANAVRKIFDLKPAGIVKSLNLLRPIYAKTSAYGHFGRKEKTFTWEATDKVNALLKELK